MLIKRALVCFLFLINIDFVYARDIFKPYLVETSNTSVCELVLDHYTNIFQSKSNATKKLDDSLEVFNPEFHSRQVPGVRGEIKIAKINIESKTKLVIYHARSHSWRGDIYTGYMIDAEQINESNEQLKTLINSKTSPFYPMGSLAYGSDFSWWENLPFQFQDNWYVLADFGDFTRHNALRSVHQIFADGSTKKVCTVKIFDNFDSDKFGKDFPFFTAYKKAVENILLSPGDCGTSNPEVHAMWNGQFHASSAIVRPWATESIWRDNNNRQMRTVSFQKKHFNDWKYQDVWSYREFSTLENTKFDAINELQNHYINNFSYDENSAKQLALKIISNIPGSYYSLGIYYDEDKDFSAFQRLVEGNYQDWSKKEEDFKLKYGTIPLVALSLMIDTPQQLEKLPADIDKESIKTFFGKDLLMFAVHMNNFDTSKYLIDSGWPIDNVTKYESKYSCGPTLDRTNRSALTYAAENSSIELIQYLVDAGADINIKDSKGNNLDFYINLNPRFSKEEKSLGFEDILKRHSSNSKTMSDMSCKLINERVEKSICNSKGLTIYERELNSVYRDIENKEKVVSLLKVSQSMWKKRRNDECNSFIGEEQFDACLARMTRARIRYLEYVGVTFK